MVQHNRRQGRNPAQVARGHLTTGLSDGLADRGVSHGRGEVDDEVDAGVGEEVLGLKGAHAVARGLRVGPGLVEVGAGHDLERVELGRAGGEAGPVTETIEG